MDLRLVMLLLLEMTRLEMRITHIHTGLRVSVMRRHPVVMP